VKTPESVAIEVMRMLQLSATREDITRLTITVHDEVATWINNKKRREISHFEDVSRVELHIVGRDAASPEHLAIEAWETSGQMVRFP